jgi:hypothetical protein
MQTKRVVSVSVMLLVLLLGTGGIAAAQTDYAPDRQALRVAFVYGVVSTIDRGSLTLAAPVGSVTAIVDANTRFLFPDQEGVGLDDLSAGDTVGAAGWWGENERVFHAYGVAKLEAGRVFHLPGRLSGLVDNVLTVETNRGSATVQVNDQTVYRLNGIEEPGRQDLEVGTSVFVEGTLNQDGSLLAQLIVVPQIGSRRIRLHGEVLAVEGDTITLRRSRGQGDGRQIGRRLSIPTDEATVFHVPGVEGATISDLQVGDVILGEGVLRGDGTRRASVVVVLPEQVARLTGTLVGIEDSALELATQGGSVEVLADAGTLWHIPGVEDPNGSDVEVDDRITAIGVWENETAFSAVIIAAARDRQAEQTGNVRGRAIRVEADRLVLGTGRGPVTALVDHETQYRVPGVQRAYLDDLAAGAVVGVRGTWNEDGTLEADGVALLVGR